MTASRKERLDDLRRVAGDLTFVDAVVADNGALVHFPGGSNDDPWRAYPESFHRSAQGVEDPIGAGQCLVDADASSAHRLLDIIRQLELPIVLLFDYEGDLATF